MEVEVLGERAPNDATLRKEHFEQAIFEQVIFALEWAVALRSLGEVYLRSDYLFVFVVC